ncbi:MAG: SHOCT domain-containing protein [Desulfobulbaceae bacterium]|nr:SHOCT domain-containing protein [Desulfobulbaceae bacterium]
MMNWMGNGGMGYGMFHGGFGMIFMFLFWLLIIWGIVSLVKYFFPKKEYKGKPLQSATEIAKMRYARGEISKDEFDRIMKDLQT